MKQDLVSWWLAQMQELYRLLLEVTQDNASDETLAGITNSHDVKGLRREDIAGDFKGDIFENEIDHFIDCIRHGKTPSSSIEQAVELQKMLMGIYRSAKEGREVKIDG